MRIRLSALAALVSLGLSACASAPGSTPLAQPSTGPTSATPSASAQPSAIPSAAVPSATPSAGPTPSRRPTKPPVTTSPALGTIKCSGSASANLPQASGIGPAGSIAVTGNKEVALTFDDGPDPVNTPKLLDLLKQCGVKATFCVVGVRAEKNPSLIRRIYDEGHTLCNHTWHHGDTRGKDNATIRWYLNHTNEIIRAIVPEAPIKYFRNPYGYFTEQTVRIAKELGMASIHWHVDPKDWDAKTYGRGQPMVNHIVSSVQRNTRPGSIVLSHDNLKPDTVTAYRILLPWLKARFKLVALPTDQPL